MAWSRRRLAIWVCVLTTATLAIGIGVATGAKLKARSETTSVNPHENGSATAKCKKDAKAVSGGFEAEFDPTGPTPFFLISESRRTGGREWTSAAHNNSAPSGDLTSFAYCRNHKLKTRSATVEVDPLDRDSVTATCRQGEKAFSGGFAAEEINFNGPTPYFLLTKSLKGKRGWRVAAFNDGTDEGDLTAYVHCREGNGVKSRRAEERLSATEFESVKAHCSRQQRVVSGGFDLDSNWTTTGAYAMESRKLGKRGWEVAARDSGGARHDLVAYAYCEKKKAK